MIVMEPTPEHHSLSPRRRMSRRAAIGTGGGATLALLLAACSSGSDGQGAGSSSTTADSSTTGADGSSKATTDGSGETLESGTPSTTAFTAADFAAIGACLLTPEQTEGPYPTETQIERRDVREGLVGHPVRLGLQVVDESCDPVPGATVEIWHCDVDGDYSAYSDGGTADDAGPGTTFLRGSQVANDEGIVEFITNYPGWYRGRAVHIHTKVHLDDTTVLTSQIFFDDDENARIFETEPYAAHGQPDTTNLTDSIANGDPAANGQQAVTAGDDALDGTRALLVLGIDPDAESTGSSGFGGPGNGGPGNGGRGPGGPGGPA